MKSQHTNTARSRYAFTLIELLVVIAIIAILAAILFPVFAQAREKARQTACLSNEKQIGNALHMYAQDYDEGLPVWADWVMTNPVGTATPEGYWQAKLQPYIKSGRPENNDNTGVWKCPSLGARGEVAERNDGKTNYSYGYNFFVHRSNPGQVPIGVPTGYRTPFLNEMDSPANTVFAGECGADGRLRMPHEFEYRKAVYTRTVKAHTKEIPDRHSGGSNYIFADGHALWINADAAFPRAVNPTSTATTTTAEKKKAYEATAKYFAYDNRERDWYTRNSK